MLMTSGENKRRTTEDEQGDCMKELNDILIVVDMQKDFIDGSLGTKEAQAIIGNVLAKISEYEKAGKEILYTRDTHFENYLETFEGKHLPVKHCIQNTDGWQVAKELDLPEKKHINKVTFGYEDWKQVLGEDIKSVELVGLCTDICVISNALLLRAFYPEMEIRVDASCCAGVTPKKHAAALEVMKSCQIDVTGEN